MESDRSNFRQGSNSILKYSGKLLASNWKVTLLIIFLSLVACSLMPLALSIPVDALILQSLAMPFATRTTTVDYFSFPRSDYSVRAVLALTISHLAFFLPIVTTIRYASLCCSEEQATTAKQLAPGIIGSSAASFFTRLCVTLLDLVPKFLLLALAKVAAPPDLHTNFFIRVVFGFVLLFQICLQSVWLLALAASVVESRWGVSAVRKALELVHGKARHVFSLALSIFIAELSILALDASSREIAFQVFTVVLVALLGVVSLAAHVVLYYYLNTRCGDDQAGAAEEYSVLATDDPSVESGFGGRAPVIIGRQREQRNGAERG